ncbi:MAG: stage II sporulation protein M [Bacteroidetes bacterium]|nr:stage II sporulation protein M [Bacteroidota bacterium]
MRESKFIRQNKEKWQEFEELLDRKTEDPDKLRDLFIQVTDDLSYARTFYPNRSVRVYLNGLAQRIFFGIYKSRKSRRNRFVNFWTDELPKIVYESRIQFRLSLLIFLTAILIGVVSSIYEPEFARVILGDNYVEMTMENIESGDPMKVYKSKDAFGSSLGITAHNMLLAFLAFVTGIFFSIGTVGMLIFNGIMVGAFQYFFIERGLFWDSFLTIWMHGAFEISAIILAGAAGLVMGKGLVFPGTYSRTKSFQIASRRGIKIMLSIAPLFVIAGFIEGFVTRMTDIPNILRGAFILLCFGLVYFYYFWYPKYKARIGFNTDDVDGEIPPDQLYPIIPERIKSGGELFSDIFRFVRSNLGRLSRNAFLATLVFCTVAFGLSGIRASDMFFFPWEMGGVLDQIPRFFRQENLLWLSFVQIAIIAWVMIRTYKMIPFPVRPNAESDKEPKKINWKHWLGAVTGSAALTVCLLPYTWATILLAVGVAPIVFLWAFAMMRNQSWALPSLARIIQLVPGRIGRVLNLSIILFFIVFFFFILLDTTLVWFILQFIGMNFQFEQTGMTDLATILMAGGALFVLYLSISVYYVAAWLSYYTLREIKEAGHLREEIDTIGMHRQIRGLARED